MTTLLNSNLLPIISVAMYGTTLEPSNLFDEYSINDDKNEGYIHFNSEWYWDNFDNNKYVKHIENLAGSFLNGTIESNGIEVKIKCGSIYSPKYYNYSNDEIDLTVTFNKTKVLNFAKKNKEQFNSFLKDNYSSYDGFSSHTANNFNEWLTDFKDNESQAIGAVLTFVLSDYIEETETYFAYYVLENSHYPEFANYTEYDNEIKTLENIVKENYLNINLETFTFESEILDFEAVQKIAKETIKIIESSTLKLDI